jgi:plastocyanin
MTARAYSSGVTRRLPASVLVLAALAPIAGCGGSGGPVRPPGPNEVVMTEYRFTPRDREVARGAELTVRNEGQLAHDLTVERPGTSKALAGTGTFLGGRARKLSIDLSPGRYRIVCTVPGHERLGMVGTLTVR